MRVPIAAPTIENSTIVRNSCGVDDGVQYFHPGEGGAILVWGTSMSVRNTIVWENAQITEFQIRRCSAATDISYSDIQDGYDGIGNIDEDPLFADESYALSENSPCIDSGDPDGPLDPDGTRAGMGAFVYYHLDAPYIRLTDYSLNDSQGNNNGRVESGETIDLTVVFRNTSLDAREVSATLFSHDPDVVMMKDVVPFGNIARNQSAANDGVPFCFSISPTAIAHMSPFYFNITADGGYATVDSIILLIGTPTILLIDDDNGDSCEGDYVEALKTIDVFPEEWKVSSKGCPMTEDLTRYEAVIWLTGDDRYSTLTQEEQATVAALLNGGGNLLIAGSNIGYDLVEDGSAGDSAFYVDYLHADFVSDSIGEIFLCGVENDPITGEFAFFAIDERQTSASVIAPRNGAIPILIYHLSREGAAIKYEGDYKLAYFALGLEGINSMGHGNNDEIRGKLMNNIVQWFNYIPIQGDVNQDGIINILDVLQTVNIILEIFEPTPSQEVVADCNADETVNILDVVGIVNVVLGIGTCPPTK